MTLRKMELAKAKHYLEEVLAHRWASPAAGHHLASLGLPGFLCSWALPSHLGGCWKGRTMLYPCNAARCCLLHEEGSAN